MQNMIQRIRASVAGITMVIPAVLVASAFLIYPIFYTIRLSVAKSESFSANGFVGFSNYTRLFHDTSVLKMSWPPDGALINTFKWLLLGVPGCLIIGMIVALVADRRRFQSVIRAAFFLPMVLSGTVLGTIFTFVYSPNSKVGLLNAIFGTQISWLGNVNLVNYAVITAWVWAATGLSVIIIAAALKGIPEEINEAARLDGANGRQLFWHITLPSIKMPLVFLVTTQLVQVLKVFDVVYVMTQGGPAGKSNTLALMFFQETFSSLNPQYGAAIVVFMSAIIVAVYLLARRLGREK